MSAGAVWVFGLVLLIEFAATNVLAKDNFIFEGQLIAVDACAACHKVAVYQRRPHSVYDDDADENVRAPTFESIAARHGNDPEYLRRAITMPRHSMREQDWNERDLDAVIAYIRSLRAPKSDRSAFPTGRKGQ